MSLFIIKILINLNQLHSTTKNSLMSDVASMDQLFLAKVNEAIGNNLANENFGVDELANEIGISRSQLHRRLKSINEKSASQLIREFRLKKADEMLRKRVATASEISYLVGFSSPSYFNTCFNEFFGYPPGKVNSIQSSRTTKRYFISPRLFFISLAALMVVAAMFILFFQTKITDKSIAVLPFKYLSDEPDKQYLADGVMEAILLHLSKIEDLRVMDRTSVEQYRETDKTAKTISQELNVAYLLSGSFQKHGDQVRLTIQLIKPGNKGNIWAEVYDRNWNDIFSVESEVAQTIARELHAVIKPDEIQLMEKPPTTSLTAYDFYQRGRGEHIKYWLDAKDREALERAEDLYHDALEYDPTFARAYTGLAWVYLDKNYWETVTTENFLDSVLVLTDMALSYDDQLAEAYNVRGDYYRLIYKKEQALNEYNKAIRFNPNDWRAYRGKGLLYYGDDLVKTIDNFNKVAFLHRGSFLPEIYRFLGRSYATVGFKDTAIYYVNEALKLDDDSAAYYSFLAEIEDCNSNFVRAIEFGKKSYAIDTADLWIIYLLGIDHMYLGRFAEALEYFKKYDRTLKNYDKPYRYEPHLVGYAYWINGFKEEAEAYNQTVLDIYYEMLELDRHPFQDFSTFHNLAAIHAFRGNKEKAYEYLGIFNQRLRMPLYMIKDIKNNPLFDSIRDEPEFQQIIKDVEAKYLAEHERVLNWLEENKML